MNDDRVLRQVAPYPYNLDELVERLDYRPGWVVGLEDLVRDEGSSGLTLVVTTVGYDSYHPDRGQTYRVRHLFPVPPATYNDQSWQRWLFDMLVKVETHEAAEFFAIDGERPYGPHHGPGNDPYIVFDHGDDEDRRTSFRGDVKEAGA